MNSHIWKTTQAEIGDYLKVELDQLIESGKYFSYYENYNCDGFIYSVFGDTENNRLYLKCENNGITSFGRINSIVSIPPMIDRRFEMDIADSQVINWLSDMMIRTVYEGASIEDVLSLWDKEFEEQEQEQNN